MGYFYGLHCTQVASNAVSIWHSPHQISRLSCTRKSDAFDPDPTIPNFKNPSAAATMKASLKFREDQRPLARAKVPISILGLPFLSGVSAGDARELRLDLATAFDSGPSLRLSYRPNDPSAPFSLLLKTGIGALGSPASAPMSISAEFNLLSRTPASSTPAFSILFKPRFGDFSIRKTTRSLTPLSSKIPAPDVDTDGEGSVDSPAVGFRPVNGIPSTWKGNGFTNGFTSPAAAAAGIGGIQGLLSGIEVTARSVLPLRGRAAVRFRWGVRVPPELRTALADEDRGRVPGAGISLSKVPLLVMSKISIEHVPAVDEGKAKGKKAGDSGVAAEVAEACMSVKRQLESLQSENGLLRKAVEDLRSEVGFGRKAAPLAGSQVQGGGDAGRGGAKPPPPPAAAVKRDRWGDGKSPEIASKATPEDVGEELKKALMGAAGAGV